MKTVTYFLIISSMLLTGTSMVAQGEEPSDEQKAQMETQLMAYFEKLDLSEDQKTKFEKITRKYGGQMRVLKDSDKGRLSKYREFKSIQANKNKEMKKLLSGEQYAIYEETQEEMQQTMREKRKNKN